MKTHTKNPTPHSASDLAFIGTYIATETKNHRDGKKLSRNYLAQKSGISIAQIRRIENGAGKPSLLVCLKLAATLGIALSDILLKIEQKQPNPSPPIQPP